MSIAAGRRKTLVVITGATASGKTSLAVDVALRLGCHVVSADSRQIYLDIPISTATPTPEEMRGVPHHFISTLPLDSYFSAAEFEKRSLELLGRLWHDSDIQVMCGGSMMYVDAVTRGIDLLPTVSEANRARAAAIFAEGGIEAIREELRRVDPAYSMRVDLDNHKRMVHAVEVSYEAGRPYSELLTGEVAERDFRILRFAVDHPRQQLFDRINRRVDAMIGQGLEEEARRVEPLRHLNSLNTVGLKEMFAMFDGTMDRETAIARIGKNTRVYAKKQLTWLRRRPDETIMIPAADPSAMAETILSHF